MSTQELQQIRWVADQFHLEVCGLKIDQCARCKAALLAKEQSQKQYPIEVQPLRPTLYGERNLSGVL
jgi:hypothetical protein